MSLPFQLPVIVVGTGVGAAAAASFSFDFIQKEKPRAPTAMIPTAMRSKSSASPENGLRLDRL
jgi:hypothetical protein